MDVVGKCGIFNSMLTLSEVGIVQHKHTTNLHTTWNGNTIRYYLHTSSPKHTQQHDLRGYNRHNQDNACKLWQTDIILSIIGTRCF